MLNLNVFFFLLAIVYVSIADGFRFTSRHDVT